MPQALASTPVPGAPPPPGSATGVGLAYALAAFSIWGLFPIYFKALAPTGAWEIVCHRVLWSVPVTALMVSQWPALRQAWRAPGVRLTLLGSATLISINWLGYVYAVESNQVLQASLGYFINPLVNVLLSLIFLGESLRRGQIAAIVLALSGTLALAIGYGQFPWLALTLAFSFGLYGLLRKRVNIDAVGGLLVETALLTPLALASMFWLGSQSQLLLLEGGWGLRTLLLAAGVITSLPLVWFTRATRRLSLTVVGMIMYLTPTLQFLLAVFLYGEVFTPVHLLSFSLIWCGLAVFTVDMARAARKA